MSAILPFLDVCRLSQVTAVINVITCSVGVTASPTSTVHAVSPETPPNDVISPDDVITKEPPGETEPCSRERMAVCYSTVGSRFNAEVGALVPNLTDTSLHRLCQYDNSCINIVVVVVVVAAAAAGITTTRSIGQSPTWGRPAPQVRVESQFRLLKFLLQQWHVDWKSFVILPPARKLLTLTRWILSQILNVHD